MAAARYTRTRQVAKILAAVLVVAYLIHLVEWQQLVASARTASPVFLATAVALLPANLLLELWLWHRLIGGGSGARGPSVRDSVTALFCGHALGLVTPARAGELFGRAVYAGHDDTWTAGALAIVHRMIDFLAVIVVSLPFYLFFALTYTPDPPVLWWGLIVLGIALFILLGAVLAKPASTYRLAGRFIRKERWLARIAFMMTWPGKDRSILLGLAMSRYMIYLTQFALLLHAFGPKASVGTGLLIGAIVFFGKLIVPPVTFTDVGIREGVSVFVAGFFAVSGAAAFNAAFTLFVVNLVVPGILGAFLLTRRQKPRSVMLPLQETGAAIGNEPDPRK